MQACVCISVCTEAGGSLSSRTVLGTAEGSWGLSGAQLGSACCVASAGPLPTPSGEHVSSPRGDGAHEVWLTLEPQASCLKPGSHIVCIRISWPGIKREVGLHPEKQGLPLTEYLPYARHSSPCSTHIVLFKPDGNLVRYELLLFPFCR